jgi:hypothetical protein
LIVGSGVNSKRLRQLFAEHLGDLHSVMTIMLGGRLFAGKPSAGIA